MGRLLKYYKKYLPLIITLVILLFIQAQAELALPDRMSAMVNVGIQQQGLTIQTPPTLTESSFSRFLAFLDNDEKNLLTQNYKLITPLSATSAQKKDYPALAEGKNLYVLQTTDKQVKAQILEALRFPLILSAVSQSNLIPIENLPEGTDLFAFIAAMEPEQKQEFLKQAQERLESAGTTVTDALVLAALKEEMVGAGLNLADLQNEYLFNSGLVMLGIALLGSTCAIAVGFLAARSATGFAHDLRQALFAKVQSFSAQEFNQFSTASLITRTTNDIQQLQGVSVMFFRMVVFSPIMGFGALIKIMTSHSSLAWMIALILSVLLTMIGILFFVAVPKFKVMQELIDRLNLVLRERLSGMLVIRAFDTDKLEEDKFDVANKAVTKISLFVNRTMSAMFPLMMLIMNYGILLIIWVCAKQIDAGTIQIGSMMAFMQYTMHVVMSFLMISSVAIMLPRAQVVAKRIAEVLDTSVTIEDPKDPVSFKKSKRGSVRFEDVSFRYPQAQQDVLSHISFTCKPGQTTAIIGSTGSGKSTLLNLIPRFFDASEGKVSVNGLDVTTVSLQDLRKQIGLVPQKGVLFSGTIASNLEMGKANATIKDMNSACDIAQASEFIQAKPNKYEEEVSQGGTNVSGGQKQRLAIARALIKKPSIYLFDDSFSALDFATDAKLRKAMSQVLKKDKATVIIVGQRISSIRDSDQILVLDEGKLVGKGTHKDLLETCKVYQEIAYSQLSKEELAA
ncbi:MAG: ABC transporter ATP-binding protein/permease [Erysipelotrichaceae bacterium]|jgi:ATP-binding cassette subfamily B protein|nr:ABC transporter ATP-binding protein/permease [Erysipelotrichaceae bacterium]